MGEVDVDVDGLSRVITDRDTRQIKEWPTPWEHKEFGPNRSVTGALLWWFPVGVSMVGVS